MEEGRGGDKGGRGESAEGRSERKREQKRHMMIKSLPDPTRKIKEGLPRRLRITEQV